MEIFEKYIPYESIIPIFIGYNNDVNLLCKAWNRLSVCKPIVFCEDKKPLFMGGKVKEIPLSDNHKLLLTAIVDFAEEYVTERKVLLLIFADRNEEVKLEGYMATLERNVVVISKTQFAEIINKR